MRERLKILLGFLGAWIPMNWLIRASGQYLLLPLYHAISDEEMPHVDRLYQVRSGKRFRRDLDFFQKHFKPGGLEVLKDPELPSFFISFDDGLSGIHDTVAPELEKRKIPAAFFINTEFIDNRELFFRYKVSLLLERFESIKYSPAVTDILQSRYHLASNTKRCVREFLTDITYRSRRELDEIAGLVDLDFEAFLKVKKPYMSFEQLMDLKKRGFYLGSHSMDHPLFADLDPEDQEKQYRASMEYLRDEFRLEYGLFSFPFHDEGVSSEFLWNLSAEYLPKLDASFGCRGLKNDPVPYHYQRIPMEVGNVPAGIIIRGEYIYYLLKGLFGRNTVKRK